MDPHDDPEARIRDLERPLSDVARTSELGAGQYGGDYTGMSPMPPPKTTSGFRGWWALIALFTATGVIGAGVVAFFLLSSSSPLTSTPGHPSRSGGGGAFASTPSSSPWTFGPETGAPTAGPSTPTAPAGGTVSVSGVGENKTIACNEGSVNVSGVSNTVVITGHCASVSVSGVENLVTVDSADAIGASGIDNRVTFHTGAPQVTNSGSSNVVEQG